MSAPRPTYILAPDWDYLPNGKISLGSLLVTPRSARIKSLNHPHITPIPHSLPITQTHKEGFDVTFQDVKTRDFGIWTSFLAPILGVGADIAVHRGHDGSERYSCRELETNYFDPDDEYIARSLSEDVVKAYVGGWRKPVYMVTGVKIAKGACMSASQKQRCGADFGVRVDGTQSGVPVGAGPRVGRESQSATTVRAEAREDFVLAYRLVRIRLKYDGSVVQKDYNTWALLNDHETETESTEKKLREVWDFEDVSVPMESEGLVGTLLTPIGQNRELEDYDVIAMV